MRRLLPAALIAAALVAPGTAAATDRGYRAEIRRTTGGVPHVKARDYGSLGFGYGFAYAQDQICRLADMLVTVNAQRSRHFGPDAESPNGGTNLQSDEIVNATPPADGGRAASAALPRAEEIRARLADDPVLGSRHDQLGSNAFGIGSRGVREGRSLVLGNPHNRHVAWSHTVSTARRFTPYELKLKAGEPTTYLVDGRERRMRRRTVAVRTPEGVRRHTFYETRWGPVIDFPAATLTWTADTAYALADVNSGNLRLVDQWVEYAPRARAASTSSPPAATSRAATTRSPARRS